MSCDNKMKFKSISELLFFVDDRLKKKRKDLENNEYGYYFCAKHNSYHLTSKYPESRAHRNPEEAAREFRRLQGYG